MRTTITLDSDTQLLIERCVVARNDESRFAASHHLGPARVDLAKALSLAGVLEASKPWDWLGWLAPSTAPRSSPTIAPSHAVPA